MTWRVNFGRSKDAQKQLARTSLIVLLERGWRGTRAQWGFGHELAKIHSTRYSPVACNWSKSVVRLDIPQLELENIRVIFPNISKIPKKTSLHIYPWTDISACCSSNGWYQWLRPIRLRVSFDDASFDVINRFTVSVNKCSLRRDLIFQVSEHDIGRSIEEPKAKNVKNGSSKNWMRYRNLSGWNICEYLHLPQT